MASYSDELSVTGTGTGTLTDNLICYGSGGMLAQDSTFGWDPSTKRFRAGAADTTFYAASGADFIIKKSNANLFTSVTNTNSAGRVLSFVEAGNAGTIGVDHAVMQTRACGPTYAETLAGVSWAGGVGLVGWPIGDMAIGTANSKPLKLLSGAAVTMTLDASQRVLINNTTAGTSNTPTVMISRPGATATNTLVYTNPVVSIQGVTGNVFYSSRDTTNGIEGVFGADGNNAGVQVGAATNHPLVFFTNNLHRMRLTADGSLLVGSNTNGAGKLQVSSGATPEATTLASPLIASFHSGGGFNVVRDVTNDIELIMGSDAVNGCIVGSITNHNLVLRTNNAPALAIDTSQRVGVGCTPSTYGKLQASSDGTSSAIVHRTNVPAAFFSATDFAIALRRNNAQEAIWGCDSGEGYIGTTTAQPFSLMTNGALRVTVDTSGRTTFGGRILGKSVNVAPSSTTTLGEGSHHAFTNGNTVDYITTTGWTAGSVVYITANAAGNNFNHNTGAVPGGTAALWTKTAATVTAFGPTVLAFLFDGTYWVQL